jgi:signal transduction histidine kinase
VFFIVFGICLVALAVALNVGWVLLNWREVALLVLGIIFFVVIIAGLVLNTIFLVKEIRRNEQHDSFINAVTHELKTPIASIKLYLETLKTRRLDEQKREEFYDIMLDDTNRLLNTVEQVLQAGRAGQKRAKINPVVLDFSQLVSECIDLARTRSTLASDAISFERQVESNEHAFVLGDQTELRAVVSNLLDNAIKYSKEKVRVSVDLDTSDPKWIVLRVTDKGVGIPREQVKRIFKRFYRAPALAISKVKGTGLGLFIVRSIVDRHGGRVRAESGGVGLGSTFTIELPRVPEGTQAEHAVR